jgi:4-amino-4-deoxy-L-arabinose transferase-like glycosyltransferase
LTRLRQIPRRELALLGGAMALGLAIRLAYVLLTSGHTLAGDEVEYDIQGRFIEQGMWFWSTTPYGEAHPSLWKTPGYTVWVGLLYLVLGPDPDRVLIVQTLIGPVTIALTWALGRRLFTPAVGLAAALVVAVHPFAWQFETRLFAESLVTPLTLLLLLLVLERRPSPRWAALVGLLAGAMILVRPSALYVLPLVVAAWIVAAGWRRGLGMSAVTAGVVVLAIAPWAVRNYEVSGAFVPLSVQGAAPYGTFNEEAASDEDFPFAWRILNDRDRPLLVREEPLPDAVLAARLRENTLEYIRANPLSVPQAFFWNGVVRLWDVRPPAGALAEVSFQGRSALLTKVGLGLHYVLLPLAIVGLVRARRRAGILVPVVVLVLSASLVYTSIGGTRYRAPLEPLIAVLAASAPRRLSQRPQHLDEGDRSGYR